MNKKLIAMAAILLPIAAAAQSTSDRLHISQMNVNKGDTLLTFNMTVDPKAYKVKSNHIVTLTPQYVSNGDTVPMPEIRIAGRKAWYAEIRENNATPLTLSRAGKSLPVEYSSTVGYTPLSGSSSIIIKADTANICNCKPARTGDFPAVDINEPPVTNFLEYAHNFRYIAPKDTADKIFNLSGRANIIFKVNRTDIDWTYYTNHAELDSILKTINAVRDNEYATVERILLTGYASPEGPYLNNVRLAKGRTEVVRKYVEDHSGFPNYVFETASVPEDWDGLREWIEASSIPNKHEMLAFIDDASIPIEKKNDLFRAKFPNDYPFLLQNVYPVLRHTDYRITYRIKKFYDVDEIAKVFEKDPKMLSLNELYLLSGKYPQGSPEYYKVFMTAAAMYPDSDIANLNAAGCAMSNGNLQAARMYLEKVGHNADSDYAWGMLYAMEEDYSKALEYLKKAAASGSTQAEEVIPEVEDAMAPRQSIVVY
ncbi:MAG: DUF3868 domain-containing protein [Muribaculaceae bacterium]|nr:DUF3868 domain-containing protein [Muribaculaceae bacterium]